VCGFVILRSAGDEESCFRFSVYKSWGGTPCTHSTSPAAAGLISKNRVDSLLVLEVDFSLAEKNGSLVLGTRNVYGGEKRGNVVLL